MKMLPGTSNDVFANNAHGREYCINNTMILVLRPTPPSWSPVEGEGLGCEPCEAL